MVRGMTVAPDRTETVTFRPEAASSDAISAAELPMPITRMDCPGHVSGRRYSVLWNSWPP